MDIVSQWGLIVGVLLPPFIAVLQQPQWSDTTRRVVAVVVSAVAGFITCVLTKQVDLDNVFADPSALIATIAAVLVASQTAYRNLWGRLARRVEVATSTGKPARSKHYQAAAEPHDHEHVNLRPDPNLPRARRRREE